jgi:transcriptional regulator with XRE-family HTH domain
MNDNYETRGKRLLEPVYTPGYVHIPQLRKKLRWLYAHHPFVTAQYKLARALGVAPATLSTWLNGMRYDDPHTVAPANPDSIPIKYFHAFVDIWGIPAAVLEIEDFVEFKNALATLESGRGAWEKMVRSIPDGVDIEIISSAVRGVVDPDDEEDPSILQFRTNDEILIRAANPGLSHGVMLLQDRFGWSCLRPNRRWKETKVGEFLIFPRQISDEAPRFARLDAVGGLHRVLVLFLADPPTSGVLDVLQTRPIDFGSLNHIAPVFQSLSRAGSDQCRVFSRRFLVSP